MRQSRSHAIRSESIFNTPMHDTDTSFHFKQMNEHLKTTETERECLATCRAYSFLFAPKTVWLYRQLSPLKLLATRDTESVRNLEVSASKSHEKGRKPCQVLLQISTILKWHKEASFHQIVYLQFCWHVFTLSNYLLVWKGRSFHQVGGCEMAG